MNVILCLSLFVNLFGVAGDSCQTAIVLPNLPFNDHLSTAGYTSALNLSDPCIQHTTLGPDIIYEYYNDLAVPCTMAFMAVPIGFWNPAIYVLSDCDPPVCVRGNDYFGPGAPETLTVVLGSEETYYFVVDGRGVNDYGIVSFSFSECYTGTGVHEELFPSSPAAFDIVPNPTNGAVDFRFSLEQGSEVSLQVYDRAGRLVFDVAPSFREAGAHSITWNGTSDEGVPAVAGTYFVKFREADREAVQKFVLMR
jgi:hypothetical protein